MTLSACYSDHVTIANLFENHRQLPRAVCVYVVVVLLLLLVYMCFVVVVVVVLLLLLVCVLLLLLFIKHSIRFKQNVMSIACILVQASPSSFLPPGTCL